MSLHMCDSLTSFQPKSVLDQDKQVHLTTLDIKSEMLVIDFLRIRCIGQIITQPNEIRLNFELY